jgi:exodeoxyribonuclease VII small subunit
LALPWQKDYEDDYVKLAVSYSPGVRLMAGSSAESVSPTAPPGGEVSKLSFEEALAELERIVRGLESGQQKLEEAIIAFERGSALRRHCEAKLAEAETRIQAIVERADGTLATRPIE